VLLKDKKNNFRVYLITLPKKAQKEMTPPKIKAKKKRNQELVVILLVI
jgi:hypothetical protein